MTHLLSQFYARHHVPVNWGSRLEEEAKNPNASPFDEELSWFKEG